MPYNPTQSTRRTSRVVVIGSNSVVELASYNANRNILELMNIDTGRVSVGFNAQPAADEGLALAAASAAGEAGGYWSSQWVPEQGPVYGRCGATASRVLVIEG